MGLTLIAGDQGEELPGAPMDRSFAVSRWLQGFQPIRDWLAEHAGKTIHILCDEPLLREFAPDSLTVPTDEAVVRRWREDLGRTSAKEL